MPVHTSYPGVYIGEIPNGDRTITGVPTSIAAFIGRTTEGPVNTAVRLYSPGDFERNFGSPHPESQLATQVRLFFLNGGSDCYLIRIDGNPLKVAEYLGNESKHTGFYVLDLVDLFNLMIIPRDNNLKEEDYFSLWPAASAYCKSHRAFLLIDPPGDWKTASDVTDPSKGIRKLREGVFRDYSAVFYPWLKVYGPVQRVAPAGAIAGLMARTDYTRGVWKAPAGMEAHIFGIEDVQLGLTDQENGILNMRGVNCIRSFSFGIVNWGARTMDGADDFSSEWKYIPVRRMALFLEESLFRGTQWVVFEPNDEPLWAQIRLNIGAFMQSLFRQGAFQGSTPAEAYFVRCDKGTTTQDDIDKGIVNILVGFAPLRPAEFVIIKIQQIAEKIES